MEHVIRPLTGDDEPIIWEMIGHGLRNAGEEASTREQIAQRPELMRYVEGWGRQGDRGYVAHDPHTQQLLGAVWFREPEPGATPELAFAVATGHRKRGIGAALLTQWVRANPEQSEVALRVNATHPAVRLYERFGFHVVDERENSVVLRRDI
jgi:ribosomal protein S18 acetylase RimI-like enzyme